ncbi:hypothetical protein ABZX69_42240 [Streptomyces sp. NPDC004074]|uniref:hypothetical protein n=1 Tax=unclassified Streptomyces TaxID=2593676 RepID=UPI0033A27C8D
MNVRKHITAAALSAVLLGGAVALAPAASAASYPNQNWSQIAGNHAGVVFHPYGDKFEIWDNLHDGYMVWVEYNYKGVSDKWKLVGSEVDKHVTYSHNVAESINGKPAYIYFRVCDSWGCSKPSWYRTWGS